jgi:hypothetical protein
MQILLKSPSKVHYEYIDKMPFVISQPCLSFAAKIKLVNKKNKKIKESLSKQIEKIKTWQIIF